MCSTAASLAFTACGTNCSSTQLNIHSVEQTANDQLDNAMAPSKLLHLSVSQPANVHLSRLGFYGALRMVAATRDHL